MRLRLALFSSLLAATFAITGCDQSSETPDNAVLNMHREQRWFR